MAKEPKNETEVLLIFEVQPGHKLKRGKALCFPGTQLKLTQAEADAVNANQPGALAYVGLA
ncbi:hypothetical protein [Luteolibacter sp. LG18]|uniref:hypothetical protein n=1 Tax=Luteolibacter sp. LG18 TaxID=2819286 RepID=UPI002B3040A1|nr:hypothetical protein llg_07000 [Luteolibacter sp. LG18]BCU79671.1 hypothetical protein llg_43860 [Luteolibacter sp. LG18]